MRLDKTFALASMALLALALTVVSRDRHRVVGGTGGGGEPTYPLSSGHIQETSTAPLPFVERTHPLAPIDLGVGHCQMCSRPAKPADRAAATKDAALDGYLIMEGPSDGGKLQVTAYSGGPIMGDRGAPDASIQETYVPEMPQSIPKGQDCVFWFSPYLQLTLRWDYKPVPGAHRSHVIVTGHWYRKTYSRS